MIWLLALILFIFVHASLFHSLVPVLASLWRYGQAIFLCMSIERRAVLIYFYAILIASIYHTRYNVDNPLNLVHYIVFLTITADRDYISFTICSQSFFRYRIIAKEIHYVCKTYVLNILFILAYVFQYVNNNHILIVENKNKLHI